ncbi:GntR family transcriptional regulator [Mycobacterium yunnanensis]|uniref:GntR family transcriptional regulator n=1 Tax=Mycobacterium yunnanensis TaxID=368477 RepID=A0A9X2ZC17_9MYCO|nr:FCD domain-containing protein [Mycobacterium yunnanensis]MCV7424502.1 GntR family transcriptional regulator [Mycobacterium yunnanensis]
MRADFDHFAAESDEATAEGRRRVQLIDATMRIIGRSGVAGLTRRSISDEAGLDARSITREFSTVDDLLIAALTRINDRYVAALRALPDDPDTALKQLAEYIAASTVEYRPELIAEYEVYLMASRRPDLRAELGRWLSAVDEFAARYVADRADRLTFVSTIEGLFFRSVTAERAISPEAALSVLERVALRNRSVSRASPAAADTLGLDPINVPAAHEQVVARLRRAIWLHEVRPGERLPSERVMAERFEVSRLTIREALRVLQGEGLITVRRGSTGGSTVAVPAMTDRQRQQWALDVRAHLKEIHEVRLGVEPVAASLAAERRSDGQLADLAEQCRLLLDSTDVVSFRRADSAFHLTIAEASGNRCLYRAVEEARSSLFARFDSHSFEVVKSSSAAAHQRILDAIYIQDEGDAAHSMRDHLAHAWSEIEAVILGA